MSSALFWFSEGRWAKIEPYLPKFNQARSRQSQKSPWLRLIASYRPACALAACWLMPITVRVRCFAKV